MAEQSRRTFLRQVSAGGAVVGAAALVPALLRRAEGAVSERPARPARPVPHAGPARSAAHRFAAPGVRYAVRVNMPAGTVRQLTASGHRLLMFKAVQSEQSTGGLPVLWSSTSTYTTRTELAWTEQYYAFVTPGDTPDGARLAGVDLTRVSPGQTLDVGAGARSTVIGGGTPGAVTISDTTATPLSCGLAQPAPAGAPRCRSVRCRWPDRGRTSSSRWGRWSWPSPPARRRRGRWWSPLPGRRSRSTWTG